MKGWRENDLEMERELVRRLDEVLLGNVAATRWVLDMVYVAHLLDDLIDKDKARTDEEISRAFRILAVDMPANPFHEQHRHELRVLWTELFLHWSDATALEKSSDAHDRAMAWMLRAYLLRAIVHCAYLVGGPDHARSVGPTIQRWYEERVEDELKEAPHV